MTTRDGNTSTVPPNNYVMMGSPIKGHLSRENNEIPEE